MTVKYSPLVQSTILKTLWKHDKDTDNTDSTGRFEETKQM